MSMISSRQGQSRTSANPYGDGNEISPDNPCGARWFTNYSTVLAYLLAADRLASQARQSLWGLIV